jgi:acetone carboxylase gamma subunit
LKGGFDMNDKVMCEDCNCEMYPDMSTYDVGDMDSMEVEYICPKCGLRYTVAF